jgi:hypothetical protein
MIIKKKKKLSKRLRRFLKSIKKSLRTLASKCVLLFQNKYLVKRINPSLFKGRGTLAPSGAK